MGSFQDTDLGFSTMSKEDILDVLWRRDGRLGSIGYGYSTCGRPTVVHGWTFRWTNTQGMGNHGTAVVVPVSKEARETWKKIKAERLKNLGLSAAQAAKFLSARTEYKWELVLPLVEAISDKKLVLAAQAYPGYGAGCGRRQWAIAWGDPWASLSKPREAALVELILHMAE